MLSWSLFYSGVLDLKRLPLQEIADPVGLVQSQALTNDDATLRVVLNGSSSTRTQSARFVSEFFGSGVQHIAFACDNIFAVVEDLKQRGASFLDIPDNYYDDLEARYDLAADVAVALRTNRILYDRDNDGEFFQIYTHAFDGRSFSRSFNAAVTGDIGAPTRQSVWPPSRGKQARRGCRATLSFTADGILDLHHRMPSDLRPDRHPLANPARRCPAAAGPLGAGEQAGANSMTLEHAPPRRRSFFTSFTLGGTQGGLILATLVFIPLSSLSEG